VRDAVRLALGTLSVVPVRPPRRLDRRTGGRAMVLAPLVGMLLGLPLVALLWLCRGLPPVLAATLAVALLAVLTRGMHLDGLADTADGLGSGRSAADALAVMRRGDVGPFGVVTVVLALLLQVTALAAVLSRGGGPTPVVLALVTSRLALPLACSRGVPAARGDGLGSVVAGSVSRAGLLVSVLLAVAAVAAADVVGGRLSLAGEAPGPVVGHVSGGTALVLLRGGAVVLPLLAAGALVLRCVRRLGGVTGDVLGACVEVAFTAALLVLAFG
jgi:adenosylcobinamide-GDP ribazoletransferase